MSLAKDVVGKLYPYLPVSLQNVVCNVYGRGEKALRFDELFTKDLAFLTDSQWWSENEIIEYQTKAFSEILGYAIKHVPFYQNYEKYVERIEDVQDLSRFPVLTKGVLREYLPDLVSDEYKLKELVKNQTSGTTGKPLVFYRTPASISFQWAVWSRHKQRFDVNYDDYHALFTGKPIVPATQRKPPFWRTNKPMNQLIFGMQHINKDTIRAIIEKLNDAPLVFYTGYPSIIYQIATTAVAAGLNMMAGPKVIFTGAEPLHEFQRNVIEAFFGCLVTDQYGTSEGVANASKCPEGNYHVDFEMGYLEVAPDDIGDDPATGELLMTGFTNLGMPLIRYAIGDRGKLSRGSCACGRHSPVLSKLEGRSEDYVLTPEGNKITRFDYIYKGVNGLEEAQVIQRKAGEIDILLVTNTEFTSDEQRKILEALTRYVSPTLEVHFKVVNDIPRTRSGKFRAVINQL